MFIEAAHALADQVTSGQLKQGLLYPPQSDILETEIKVAARAAKVVFDSNLARVARPADCEAFIRSHVYKPEYRKSVFTNRKRTIPIGQPPRRHRVFPDRE